MSWSSLLCLLLFELTTFITRIHLPLCFLVVAASVLIILYVPSCWAMRVLLSNSQMKCWNEVWWWWWWWGGGGSTIMSPLCYLIFLLLLVIPPSSFSSFLFSFFSCFSDIYVICFWSFCAERKTTHLFFSHLLHLASLPHVLSFTLDFASSLLSSFLFSFLLFLFCFFPSTLSRFLFVCLPVSLDIQASMWLGFVTLSCRKAKRAFVYRSLLPTHSNNWSSCWRFQRSGQIEEISLIILLSHHRQPRQVMHVQISAAHSSNK